MESERITKVFPSLFNISLCFSIHFFRHLTEVTDYTQMLTMFLLFPHMYSPSTFLLFLCCHHHYHKYRQEDIITISSQLSPPSTHPLSQSRHGMTSRAHLFFLDYCPLISVYFLTLIQRNLLLCRSFFPF